MKTENNLKVFLLNQTMLEAEWSSLMGDKYRRALPFNWDFTGDLNEAHVVAWDGVLTPKSSHYLSVVVEMLKNGDKVLLLQHEALTLFKESPFVDYMDLDQVRYVELQTVNVVPEDLIMALQMCHKKLSHV